MIDKKELIRTIINLVIEDFEMSRGIERFDVSNTADDKWLKCRPTGEIQITIKGYLEKPDN